MASQKIIRCVFCLHFIFMVFVWAGGVTLETGWKFKTGDNIAWAQSKFNDKGWSSINPKRLWEEQGYGDWDGHAWYRIQIVIPANLKETSFLKDSLELLLGMIDDTDQTYLNGQLIGQNGRFISLDEVESAGEFRGDREAYRIVRKYRIPIDDPRILWDRENVIAVRVHDHGGGGGLYSETHQITMVDIKDYISIDEENAPFNKGDNNLFQKHLIIENHSAVHTFKGQFQIEVYEVYVNREVLKKEESVNLRPQSKVAFDFSFQSTRQERFVAKYQFTESNSGVQLIRSQDVPYILTPSPPETPRINGPAITAATPGSPFLYRVPTTGLRPITFTVKNLPDGLTLDSETGIITGKVKKKGKYNILITAKNIKGKTKRTLTIQIGDQLALTPPLGWNSWNCWGLSVSDEKVRQAADAFVSTGLADHGWTYLNIDDGWEAAERSSEGQLLANEKFPDMTGLADYVHAQGLKLGIYSSPGPLTCGRYLGSHEYERKDVETWANWGIDYLKYDWCSYNDIALDHSLEELQKPYVLMRSILNEIDRDIVFSLCQYGWGNVWEWGAVVGGNLWRTTGDITDTWESMRNIGFDQTIQWPYAEPGHWNDPDMLVVGWVGWGPELHLTHLSASEQYTHISLWSLLASPLLLGCDLTKMDDFTLNLLTNDEVLAVNQDILGKQARQILISDATQIWVKPLADGSLAVGLFNLSDDEKSVSVDWTDLGISGKHQVRDLWRQMDLGIFNNVFETSVPIHGVVLIKLISEG
ncbi:putative Ig domain-containing protein [bacterium]